MKRAIYLSLLLFSLCAKRGYAQQTGTKSSTYLVPVCVYQGDTIPSLRLPTIYVYAPLKFKNDKERKSYDRLVRDVKKTLPIAKEITKVIIETYEYMQTLPNEKARNKHIKRVEKGLKEQYTPTMKKLTISQGKLLIKLINRETKSSSYDLVKSFMGSFKAGFYQTFASLFGASLKKEFDAEEEDALTERVIILVESGQL
ncbi:MAG: DUF4294 domain-containing protein [Phocaeicola sp.]